MSDLSSDFAVIGSPISHSQSPTIHREFGQQFGLDIHYGLLEASTDEFAQVAKKFFLGGGRGLNVTVPNKEYAARWVDHCTPRGIRSGAVNTLGTNKDGTTWGDNTDGAGLLKDLMRNHRVSIEQQSVLIVGAGGAARGVLAALIEQHPSVLAITNRTLNRAQELAVLFSSDGFVSVMDFGDTARGPWDLIINATSAGLHGHRPPLPEQAISSKTIAYDLQYGQAANPFCDWASKHGAQKTLTGWGMLVEQAALAFELWHGLKPDTRGLLEKQEIGFRL